MFTFNARQVAPATAFEPWADGWYPVVIKRTNIKPTKDNDGGYLQLDLECIGGPNQGKVNFIRLNLFNKNQQAVEIAHKQLSAICHVIGVYDVNANAVEDQAAPMIHNLPFNARCTTNTNKETGQSGNNFVAFKDMNGNDPGKQGGQPAAPQPQGYAPQPSYAPQGQPQWGAPQGDGQPQGQPSFQPGQPTAQPWTGGVASPAPSWPGQQGPGPGAPQQPQPPQWSPPQGQPQQPAAPQPQGGQPQWAGGQPSQPGPQPQQPPNWQQNPAGAPPPNAPWGPR